MTCPFCQTRIGDDDHRCPHCARRVRAVPPSILAGSGSGAGAATATARAYDYSYEQKRAAAPEPLPASEPETRQGGLFSQPVNSPRVISLEDWKRESAKENRRGESKHATLESSRPAPVETAKVTLRRPRTAGRRVNPNQPSFDFLGSADLAVHAPMPSIICDASVASAGLRVQAASIDGGLILAGCAVAALLYKLSGGSFALDRHLFPFLVLGLITVPLFYKLLWAWGNRDTFGMQAAHLRLVDFDGNPPSQRSRYLRLFGSLISLLAAGIGLIWSFVDEDRLTWQDHISETFPTPAGEEL